jgi:phenylpropionate dioxygenase-like ring-hydroxylating dioxygenase large terminal subunit
MSLLTRLDDLDIDLAVARDAPFMDPDLYLAPEVYDIDIEGVLPSCWVVIGDTGELAQSGAWVAEHIGDRHVVVVRDGEHLVAVSAGPCRAMAGRVASTTSIDEATPCPVCTSLATSTSVDHAALVAAGATAAAVDVWERFVFVDPSGSAGTLHDYLAPLPELLRGHHIGQQQPIVSFVHQSASNWKLLVDNGFCDYHVPFVHGRLMPLIQHLDTWGQQIAGNITILTAPLTPAGLEGQPLYPGVGAALGDEGADLSMAMGIYPNVLLLGFRTGAVHLITWWPRGIDRTEVRVRTYDHVAPSDDDMRYGAESVELLQREDIGVCELVQLGLASAGYRPGPRHRLETRVLGFHQRYVAHLEHLLEVGGRQDATSAFNMSA